LNRAARGEEDLLLPCLKVAPRGEKVAPWEAPSRGKKGEGRHGWELGGHGRSLRTHKNRGKKQWGKKGRTTWGGAMEALLLRAGEEEGRRRHGQGGSSLRPGCCAWEEEGLLLREEDRDKEVAAREK
jgi:hypothetical protein